MVNTMKEISGSLIDVIKYSNAKLMTVVFTKKDGTTRKMFCKVGVRRYLSKKPNKKLKSFNPNIVNVFDVELKAYRSIRADSINSVILGGKIYE